MRSPAANRDHTCWLAAVAGGVHGRSAAAGAPSTVNGLPFTVIRAPAMGSTERTWLSFLILARSARVRPPGTAAMTSGTMRRGTAVPAAEAVAAGRLSGAAARSDPVRLAAPGGVAAAWWRAVAPVTAPGLPVSAPTVPATAMLAATRPPPMTAGHVLGRMVSCLTVTSLYNRLELTAKSEGMRGNSLALRLRSDYDAG